MKDRLSVQSLSCKSSSPAGNKTKIKIKLRKTTILKSYWKYCWRQNKSMVCLFTTTTNNPKDGTKLYRGYI